MSTGYLESEWCCRELADFAERHKGDLQDRIFAITLAPLRRDLVAPQYLRDLRKYRFWEVDPNDRPRTFAHPVASPEDKEYWRQVDDLASDISSALLDRRSNQHFDKNDRIRSPGDVFRGPVFLAEVSIEMQPRHDDVRRFLQQWGVNILPIGSYPTSFDGFLQAVSADLARAAVFVQVLGDTPDDPRAAPQYEAARRIGVPTMQWRSPDLKVDHVTSPVWRALLELATVQAVPIEDFKQAILAELRRLERTPPTAPTLLINANPIDQEDAYRLQDALPTSLNSEIWLPDPTKQAEEIETDLREKTVGCDAVLVVYANADADWVGRQMKQVQKISPEIGALPQLRWVVYGPPEPKERLKVRLNRWETRSVADAIALLPAALGR